MSPGPRGGFALWRGELVAGAALVALLGAAILVAHLPLGTATGPAVFGLAGLEALVVGVFLMKLRVAPALVVLAASAGLFWTAALFAMTMTDYPFRQSGERLRTFPAAEPSDAPPSVGSGLPDR